MMPDEQQEINVVPDFVGPDLKRLGVDLDREQLRLLAGYLDLLLEVNQRVNLTGIRDRDEAWRRHIVDSLTLLPGLEILADGGTVIDVGSGGGLPGIPVAIARPGLKVTLLEATTKKATFLQSCIDRLPLPNTRVIHDRAEQTGQSPAHRQRYDIVTSRAIGPLREALEYMLPLARQGGRVLLMKGPRVEQELDEAGDALAILGAGDLQVFDAYPEGFDVGTIVVSIVKDRPTPKGYPRLPGVPRKTPL